MISYGYPTSNPLIATHEPPITGTKSPVQSVMMAIYDSPCRPEDQLKVLKIISHQIFLSSLDVVRRGVAEVPESAFCGRPMPNGTCPAASDYRWMTGPIAVHFLLLTRLKGLPVFHSPPLSVPNSRNPRLPAHSADGRLLPQGRGS